MKFKFKVQPYQTNAVDSVVDCFAGQPHASGTSYRIDPGSKAQTSSQDEGFKNADLQITDAAVLANIKLVQQRQNLTQSATLAGTAACKINLDVEMETGTGKTYCYIKTMFELNQRYGWSKFIVVVPSIAIREGVFKSLEITAEHFLEDVQQARPLLHLQFQAAAQAGKLFVRCWHQCDGDQHSGICGAGADNRRIYEELDDFQSRRPLM